MQTHLILKIQSRETILAKKRNLLRYYNLFTTFVPD